jgi:hypothetical protein
MGTNGSFATTEVDEERSWTGGFAVAGGVFIIGLALIDGLLGSQGTGTDAAHGMALGAFLICGGLAQGISDRRPRLKRALWTAAFLFAGGALAVIFL